MNVKQIKKQIKRLLEEESRLDEKFQEQPNRIPFKAFEIKRKLQELQEKLEE